MYLATVTDERMRPSQSSSMGTLLWQQQQRQRRRVVSRRPEVGFWEPRERQRRINGRRSVPIKPPPLYEVQVTGDGECFFRSVAVHAYGNENEYRQVKKDLLDYVEGNLGRPGPLLRDMTKNGVLDVSDEGRTTIRQQLSGSNRLMHTESSVFALVSELYKVRVLLYHDVPDMEQHNTDFGAKKYNKVWHFVRRSNHFNPLIES